MSKNEMIKDIYSLTPMQEGMLFDWISNKHSETYFEQLVMDIDGDIEIDVLDRAINLLIERHDVLRSIFLFEKLNKPQQVVLNAKKIKVDFEDLSNLEEDNQLKVIEEILQNDRNNGFDLTKDILVRMKLVKFSKKSKLIFSFHHIILDGWSLAILVKELLEVYNKIKKQEKIIFDKEPLPFKDYIQWLKKRNKEESLTFWRDYLAEYGATMTWPEEEASLPAQHDECTFYIDKDLTFRLKKLAEDKHITIGLLIQGLWGILLQKYNNTNDVVFGIVVSGRNIEIKNIEDRIGIFINTLPFRVKCNQDTTFNSLFHDLQQEFIDLLNYQNLSLSEINYENFNSSKIKSILAFENYPMDQMVDELNNDNLNIRSLKVIEKTNYPFTLTVVPGETLEFKLTYNSLVFNKKQISDIEAHFKNIINEILNNNNVLIKDIEILSTKEKEKIIKEFNNTKTNYPQEKTTVEIFEEQVKKNPQNIAVECKNEQLTYQELNERSNQMAHFLRKKGVKPSESIGLIVERSIDTIVGILGILKAGASYLPLEADYPIDRIQFMLEDSETQIILGHSSFKEKIPEGKAFIEMERLNLKDEEGNNLTHVNMPTDTIYTIYTSGSTGNPKGSIIQHKSVIRLVKNTNYIDIQKEDKILQLSNYAFDGSVFDIFGALLNGATLVLISKEELLSMEILGEIIEEKGISIFFITTALFNSLIDLNLSCLKNVRKILFGGERVSLKHIQKAFDTYGPGKLVHVYGPTENTVFTTYKEINELSTNLNTVPIGKPIANTSVYILDENNKIVPIGVPGELCISGDGLSKGYLNHQELTKKSFIENPYEQGTKLYKTGDRVKWLPNGDVVFLERKDAQVKIRGFRIELEEIEQEIIKYPKVREAIVNITEPSILSAYYVSDEQLNSKEIKEYLKKKIPEFMIPTNIVAIDRMPLNINGKVDKSLLPKITVEEVKAEYIPPRNEMEKNIVDIFCDVLKLDQLGINSNFFENGGQSLLAISVISKIKKELGLTIPISKLFENPTPKSLAEKIDVNGEKIVDEDILMIEEKDFYDTSFAQKRMYFLNELDQNSKNYNITGAIKIIGDINKEKLKKAIFELEKRHEVLRTSFAVINGELKQQIKPQSGDIELEILQKCSYLTNINTIINNFSKPFNLNKNPLFRIGLFEINNNENILIIDIHHIIADGITINILINDLFKIYQNQNITKKTIDYKEYVYWNNSNFNKGVYDKQKDFWLEYFKEGVPILDLPLDFKRPKLQNFEGDEVGFTLNNSIFNKIKSIARLSGSTEYVVLLAIFKILLSKYGNAKQVIVGSPTVGRKHENLKNVAGLFVNTVAIKTTVDYTKSFNFLLNSLKENCFEIFDNSDYPFEKIVEKVVLKRDSSRNPLFDVMFSYENIGNISVDSENLKVEPFEIKGQISKFDLNLNIKESNNQIVGRFEYCTKLFKKSTINRLTESFLQIINTIIENPNVILNDLEILTQEDLRISSEINSNNFALQNKALIEYYEESVSKFPHNIALVQANKNITYNEMNEKVNYLANLIKDKGIKNNDVVALIGKRSIEMVIGAFAILKAGGTYLPISEELPNERINYILKDSNAKLVLTTDSLYLDDDYEKMPLNIVNSYNEGSENLKIDTIGTDVAYIMYTSGSTGHPKGVIVDNNALVNALLNQQKNYPVNEEDAFLFKTNISFDVSLIELFGWFFNGGKLVVLENNEEKNPELIIDSIKANNITHINFVPTMLFYFTKYINSNRDVESLKYVFAAGEALSPKTAEYFLEKIAFNIKLINLYGPTEATIYTTHIEINKFMLDEATLPIGKTIDNYKIYIVDENLKMQPIGVAGELCISGVGVAKGYKNLTELSLNTFIESPFEENSTMYKTGDIAKLRDDGSVYYLGRKDNQIKLRGYRIEIDEIEKIILSHSDIENAVVILKEDKDNKSLVAFYTGNSKTEEMILKEYLRERIPEYMIPSQFVYLENMPVNSNGKIDIKILKNINLIKEKKLLLPSNETETLLLEIWSDVLNLKEISTTDTFFELGGHSISIIEVISKIEEKLKVRIKINNFIEHNTIQKMARLINSLTKGIITYEAILPNVSELYEPFPLTEIQTSYLIGRSEYIEMGGGSTHIYVELESSLNMNKLNDSLQKVINRHPMLRAVILPNGEQQIIENVPDYKIEIKDISHSTIEEQESFINALREKMSHHVFDTNKWPLLDIKAAKLSDDRHYLFIGIDPLIADGASLKILERDLMYFYNKKDEVKELKPIEITFRDYMIAYNKLKYTDIYQRDKKYWLEKIEDFPISPNLPLMKDPSNVVNSKFKRKTKKFSKEVWNQIKQLCQKHKVTPSMFFSTIYGDILSFWSNQKDLAINLTTFNRYPFHKQVNEIIGDFTSVMLLPITVKGNKDFWNRVQMIQKEFLEGLEHRHYEGVEFIRELARKRNLVNKAVMPIVFTSMIQEDNNSDSNQNEVIGEIKTGISQTTQVYLDQQIYFDDKGLLTINWDYVEELFSS